MTLRLLDTSALLAHYFHEPGWEFVHELLIARSALIAAPTRFEFLVRLAAAGANATDCAMEFARCRILLSDVVPVDDAAAGRAWELRQTAATRVPAVDALIAGCASSRGAVLVHRDPHFKSIPKRLLEQHSLLPRG